MLCKAKQACAPTQNLKPTPMVRLKDDGFRLKAEIFLEL